MSNVFFFFFNKAHYHFENFSSSLKIKCKDDKWGLQSIPFAFCSFIFSRIVIPQISAKCSFFKIWVIDRKQINWSFQVLYLNLGCPNLNRFFFYCESYGTDLVCLYTAFYFLFYILKIYRNLNCFLLIRYVQWASKDPM